VITDFDRVLGALHRSRVDFIVVGGVAATAHGSARVTFDIDLLYSRGGENIARLADALEPLSPYPRGAPPGLPFEWSAATIRAGLNFTLNTTAGSVDLLGEIAGGGQYDEVAPHATAMTLGEHDTLVIDLPWLIRTKIAAGRPKDLEVLAELELLRNLDVTNRDQA
jgi:hypothetical protein